MLNIKRLFNKLLFSDTFSSGERSNEVILINTLTQRDRSRLFAALRITASAPITVPASLYNCLFNEKEAGRNKLRQLADDVNDLIARRE